MNATNLIPFPSEYERLRQAYLDAHEATKQAWIAEVAAADALYKSKTWKHLAPNWDTYCSEALGLMPYRASTYRAMKVELPLAELVQSAVNAALTPYESRQIREKLNDIMPNEELPMKLSVLALCYAHDSKPVPDKNIIEQSYAILAEERDNHSISLPTGETINYKESAQLAILRERVVQDIQSRSKRETISIEEKRHIALFLRLARRLGHNVRQDGKKLFISVE